VKISLSHSVLLTCFAYREKDYENLLDQYEVITRTFTGWSLTEIKQLSVRERLNWLERSKRGRR